MRPATPIRIVDEETRLVDGTYADDKLAEGFDCETPQSNKSFLSQIMRVRQRTAVPSAGFDSSDPTSRPYPAFYPLTHSHSLPSTSTSYTTSRLSILTSTVASSEDDIHATLDYVDQLLAQDSYRRLDAQSSGKSWWRRVFCMC